MQNAPLLIRTLHIYVWYKLLFLEYTKLIIVKGMMQLRFQSLNNCVLFHKLLGLNIRIHVVVNFFISGNY